MNDSTRYHEICSIDAIQFLGDVAGHDRAAIDEFTLARFPMAASFAIDGVDSGGGLQVLLADDIRRKVNLPVGHWLVYADGARWFTVLAPDEFDARFRQLADDGRRQRLRRFLDWVEEPDSDTDAILILLGLACFEDDVKRMPVNEFKGLGLLAEVNRSFFHPLGLALKVIPGEHGDDGVISGIWDCRDDPEGVLYGQPQLDAAARGLEIADQLRALHAETRTSLVGDLIQPLDRGLPG